MVAHKQVLVLALIVVHGALCTPPSFEVHNALQLFQVCNLRDQSGAIHHKSIAISVNTTWFDATGA